MMKMKRILALALALVLVMGMFPGQVLATEPTTEPTVETTAPGTTETETTEEPAGQSETQPSVPETTVPETTVPETTVPETTVPETTVPETTVPETTVPETTVPETTEGSNPSEPGETEPKEDGGFWDMLGDLLGGDKGEPESAEPEPTTLEIPQDEENSEQLTTEELYKAMFQETTLRGLFVLVNENVDAMLGFDIAQVHDFEYLVYELKAESSMTKDEKEALKELLDNVETLKDMLGYGNCTECGGTDGSHTANCSQLPWKAERTVYATKAGTSVVGTVKSSKTLVEDKDGNQAIQIDVWTEGETKPVDVVLVLDQSGSMFFQVDGEDSYMTYSEFLEKGDRSKGEYPGYYMVVTKNGKPKDTTDIVGEIVDENYQYCTAMIRYNSELNRWERSSQIRANKSHYDQLTFRHSFGADANNNVGWSALNANEHDYFDKEEAKYYKTRYGATVDGMLAFVDELSTLSDCRVAVAGFASSSARYFGFGTDIINNYAPGSLPENDSNVTIGDFKYQRFFTYGGTGVFNGDTFINRRSNTTIDYAAAFKDLTTTDGLNTIYDTIRTYSAHFSQTSTQDGMFLANALVSGAREDAAKYVVLFTDGAPAEAQKADFTNAEYAELNDSVYGIKYNGAINYAKRIKDNGIEIYTVSTAVIDESGQNFLRYLSSNYPSATMMTDPGTEADTKYSLFSSSSDVLVNAFKKIATDILESSQLLDERSQVRDTVTPYFDIGGNYDGGAIKAWSIPYVKNETIKELGFDETQKTLLYGGTANSVTVTIQQAAYDFTTKDGTVEKRTGNQVIVTGFDYQENSVYTDLGGGAKLRIQIPIVPDPDFIGGNNVETNSADSGIYDGDGNSIVLFPLPETDVELAEIELAIPDLYGYLGSDAMELLTMRKFNRRLTLWQGEHPIAVDLSKEDYGLSWQDDYADIQFALLNANGTELSDGIADIREDTQYSVRVTVTPTEQGSEKQHADAENANIFVFYPELTFNDKFYWYGETVPTSAGLQDALITLKWKNRAGYYSTAPLFQSGKTQLIGTAPEVTFTCTPDASGILPKTDVDVNVAVTKIGYITGADQNEYAWFSWNACMPDCGLTVVPQDLGSKMPDAPEFYLHMNNCRLTIAKAGGESGEPYVFTVKKDGEDYTQVTVVGNSDVTIYELPVGTYSIEEATDWSWRFATTAYDKESITLSRDNPDDRITCTNSSRTEQWLNDYSDVITNTYGVSNS